ncbi:hypothetical protein Neosp_001489 [[Neocosmospora] mangrovei]
MGLALRKALAFDLHQSSDDQMLDEREREVRRRLWWSIYSLERCTTIKLNRPRSVDAGIIKTPLPVPLPSLDKTQKFDNIQLQIAYAHRATDSETRSTEPMKPTELTSVEAELRKWKDSLPQSFDLENIYPRDSRYRAVFHLYLNYYHAWIAIGKVSLITAVRTTLQHHLGQESSQPLRIDGTIEGLSKSCTKAARKLLQLFEDLTRIRNTARFSFTDFQGCSIATIVTLIAGILERDSTYESRVNFGLNCLRDMAAGNLTAKVGVRFVETLQSISDEAARKLRRSGTFSGELQEDSESLQPSAYNDWAAWLASQQQPQTNHLDGTEEQETATGPEIITRERSAPDADLCNLQNTDEDAGWSGQVLEPLSTTRLLMQQSTTVSEPLVRPENDFTSAILGDDQSFFVGLTGLDVLDFAGYSTQLD